jgi:hypothetical protein
MNIPYSIIEPFEPLGFPILMPVDHLAILKRIFGYINAKKRNVFDYLREEKALQVIAQYIEECLGEQKIKYTTIVHKPTYITINGRRVLHTIIVVVHYMTPDGTRHHFGGTVRTKHATGLL